MVNISDDIIRKALNESIDEFIINEGGAFQGMKNWANKYNMGGIANGIKNATAMFMDWRTNGKWNNKYGIYANGNGKMTEMYYLNKWFNYHLNEIKRIERYANDPSNYTKNTVQTKKDAFGNIVSSTTYNHYDDVSTYSSQVLTPQNFNGWVRRFIQNREALECIDSYISNYANKITNIREAIRVLNVPAFLGSEEGKTYLQYSNKTLRNQQSNQSQPTTAEQPQPQQQVQQQAPIPDRSNGMFIVPKDKRLYKHYTHPEYKDWIISYEKKTGRPILINPNDYTQAVYMP